MKTLTYFTFLLIIVITGCRKDEMSEPEERLYEVNFSISNFSVKENASTFSGDTIKSFKYYVYNASGDIVETRGLTEGIYQPTNIKLKLKLATGSYKVIFIAGDAAPGVYISDKLDYANFEINSRYSYFYRCVDLVVGEQNTALSVKLDRINSGLEFQFMDAVPDNVKFIQVSYGDYKYMGLNGSFTVMRSLNYRIDFVQTSAGRIPVSNVPFIFDTDREKLIGLTYYDHNNVELSTRVVKVTCYKNRKTIISGNFFVPAEQTASVSAN